MLSAQKRNWFLIAGIIILGIAVRSACFRDTFREKRVYFYATDSWYHMRRIVYALKNNFSLPDFPKPDPYLNYPEGGQGYWGPLFDLGIASVIKIASIENRYHQEILASIVPAILGGLCSLAVFLLGSLYWDKATGLWSALFLSFLPGHIFYSQLGNVDHHVAESLLFGLILYASIASSKENILRAKLYPYLAGFLIFFLYLISPSTSNVHIGVIWLACLAHIGCEEEPKQTTSASMGLGFILAGLLMLGPAIYYLKHPASGIRLWGDLPSWLMIEWYSFLQPTLLFFGGMTLLIASKIKQKEIKNMEFFILCLGCLILLFILFKPMLAGLGVLFKNNPDLKFTSEAQPILYPSGAQGIYFGVAFDAFGYAFLLFPLWWWHLFLKDSKNKSLLLCLAGLFILVMLQLRFVYLFSYAMALALGWSAREIFKYKKIWMAGLLAGIFLLWPSFSWLYGFAQMRKYISIEPGFYDACLWLKENTPPTRGYYNPDAKPEYSTIAIWDKGHAIVYLAERPVVADPFNHGFEISAKYFTTTDPVQAVEVLKQKNVRFVFPFDLSSDFLQKAFAAYGRLPPDHPIYNGEWFRIFQMKLLTGIPLLGPDGKPFNWGHHLVYRSKDNSTLLFEFDPF